MFLANVFHAKMLQVMTIAKKINWAIVRQFQKFRFKFVTKIQLLADILRIAPEVD
jgi:hypothetical protein